MLIQNIRCKRMYSIPQQTLQTAFNCVFKLLQDSIIYVYLLPFFA